MGVDPYIDIVCGVNLNRKQLSIFRKNYTNEYIPVFFEEFSKYIEEVPFDGSLESECRRDLRYDWQLNPFVVRDSDKKPIFPIKYKWEDNSTLREHLFSSSNIYETIDSLTKFAKGEGYLNGENEKEAFSNLFYLPIDDEYGSPLIGTLIEHQYSGIVWHLTEFFKATSRQRLRKYKGIRPWGIGIVKEKGGYRYMRHDPANLERKNETKEDIEKQLKEEGKRIIGEELTLKKLFSTFPTKRMLEEYGEKVWRVRHQKDFPYYVHSNEMIGWGAWDYRRVEVHLRVLKKMFNITIDPMEMNRWLFFGWR